MSIVIIDNRSISMKKEDFNIIKPHFIDRFEKKSITKGGNTTRQCIYSEMKPKEENKKYKSPKNIQKSNKKHQELKKIKQELLAMLKDCKQQEELDLLFKKVAIAKQRQEHRQIIEEIRQKMAILKKQIYQLYRHTCANPKEQLCHFCQKREQAYYEQVVKYLTKDQEEPEQPVQIKVLKEKISQKKTGFKRNSANSYESRYQQNQIYVQENQDGKQKIQNYLSKNSRDEARSSARLSGFRINRKTDKIKTMRRKVPQNQLEESKEQNNNAYFSKETQAKNRKKNTVFRVLQNNVQSTKNSNNLNELQSEEYVNQSSRLLNVTQEVFENHKKKRSYRKSSLKSNSEEKEQVGDSQSHSMPKSKFYDLNFEQKIKKSVINDSGVNGSRDSKSLDKKVEDGQHYKLVKQKPKQKLVSYQRSKNARSSQFLMDLTDLQSSKNIEEVKVHRQRDEIEQLIQERQSVDNAQPKLSRYQRERLIYGYLKKELIKMGCVDEDNDTADYLFCSNSESQASIDSFEGTHNYSTKDRKHSLLQKLSIFNQSVNFQDMKTKIQNVIQQKEALGQNLIEYTRMVAHTRGRKEQKIVEKFLSEVLKINDLKRLLRKKFSKELDWNPKMREMHQFYTYLEFNLQNFRMNLEKNTENNWKQLSLEGKGQEFNLDQLNITEDLGHYQGLENTEITEFQHHKEIQCSMRYYGIEVKRLQQLQHFMYPPLETPHLPPQKVAQKSLKQIQQCEVFEDQDFFGG